MHLNELEDSGVLVKEKIALSWLEWVILGVINILLIPSSFCVLSYILTVDKDVRLFIIALISIIIIYTLSLLLFIYIKKIKVLEKYTKKIPSTREAENLVKKLMFTTDKDVIQKNLHYKLIKVTATIDNEGNCTSTYRYKGTNISRNSTISEITVRTANDSAIEYHKMNMSAIDLINGTPLLIKLIEDTLYYKKSNIILSRNIRTGEEFDIEWNFTWPNSMREMGDFIGIDMRRYPSGVEILEIELIFEWELFSIILLEIKGQKQVTSNTPLSCFRDELGCNHYSFTINNPHVDFYRFSYSAAQAKEKNS